MYFWDSKYDIKMNYAIITAGGIGKRMNTNIPKQFMEIGGRPILMHTIKRFYDFDNNIKIILSLPKEYINLWKQLCEEHLFLIKHKIVEGGKTRFHSIKNALNEINEKGFVAVHDGVRPFVSKETIEKTFASSKENGNGIASLDIFYSIRKFEDNISIAKNRNLYKEIQTPQTFEIKTLKKAYLQDYDDNFTDDASVVEKLGKKIFLTEGNRENIKITTPFDITLAEAIMNSFS